MVVSGSCLFSYFLIIFIKLPNQSVGMFARLKSYSLRGSWLQLYSSINCLKLKAELRVVFYQTLKGSHDFPQTFLWMILIKNTKSTVRRYSSTIVVSLRMWVFLTSFLTVISKREIISKIKHWELQKQPVTKPSFLGTQAISSVCILQQWTK